MMEKQNVPAGTTWVTDPDWDPEGRSCALTPCTQNRVLLIVRTSAGVAVRFPELQQNTTITAAKRRPTDKQTQSSHFRWHSGARGSAHKALNIVCARDIINVEAQ